MRRLSQIAKIVPIATYASANSDRTSEVIDTAGYGGLMIIVHFGTIAVGAVTTMKLQHSDAATNETTLNTGVDVEGSLQTIADDDDNQIMFWDGTPSKRYMQVAVDKDATNATAESMIAILYNGPVAPVTHAAGGSGVGAGTAAVTGEFKATWVDGTA